MTSNSSEYLELAMQHWRQALDGRADPLPETLRSVAFAGSEFVFRTFTRELDWLLAGNAALLGRALHAGEMSGLLAAALQQVGDETDLEQALRCFRNRHLARIVWRDLNRLAPLDETLEDLSELADVCIGQTLDLLYRWAIDKDGVPRDRDGRQQHLVVLGMGKLGARELNLSSDIDLIFCFPEHGHTDGRRQLENENFFARLGRRLIKLLGRQTADGFVFRVDMRLRPFGDAGPLVVSFDAMEQYLYSQAREWERYAMVKARTITGEHGDREALQRLIDAFVYRRYIDFGAIEAIRDLKRMIERELYKKGMEGNIKLGMGGIREIEFIGQAFQLVRGGRDRELQIRPIQQVLACLGDKELLPEFVVRELREAYVFLRLTENRIQAWKDQQSHVLPADADAQARLATGMGFEDWQAFVRQLDRHRRHVHSHFQCVFEAPQAETSDGLSPLGGVWLNHEQGETARQVLQQAGFGEDAAAALQRLETFRESSTLRTLSANARIKVDQLVPLTLDAIAAAPTPLATLERVVALFEAILRRTAYIDLLVENPLALSQLVRLLGESAWVGTQLARQPILLDELLDPRRLYSPLRRADLTQELVTLLASVVESDEEQEMERLRQFAQGNRLRVAAADIAGAVPLMVVSDYLTEIAEVSVQQVQQSAWRDIVRRYGRPTLAEGFGQGFAVIGYGKLGGIELGYGSDLDLVFLHGSDSLTAVTDGKRQVANDVFYARLGQRMIHMLTTRMPSGQLYEVDMRLRPNGNSGLLVSSMKAFEQYQHNDAWTWEHQALIRARAVCGDPAVIEQFRHIRRQVLCAKRDPDKLRDEVRQMRARMASQLDKSNAESFDIKQGAGGLVDVEFMVQYAVLRWAAEYPGLTDWTDNARLLERLAEYRLLQGQAAERLFDAYRSYRVIIHRRALQERAPSVRQDELAEERATVRDIWQCLME